MNETVHCYGDACCLLADTRKDSRRIANNTFLVPRDNDVAVKLHNTDVLTFCADGRIILNTGGWRTVTTKARINEYLPSGWRVYSERGKWILHSGSWGSGVKYDFAEGITINLDGAVSNTASSGEVAKEERLRKDIVKYANGYVKALYAGKIGLPDGGDCWYCHIKVLGDSDHLLSHMKEQYYVPSLLFNALTYQGAGKAWHWDAHALMGEKNESGEAQTFRKIGGGGIDKNWGSRTFRRSIRRYLKRQLGIA